VQQPAGGLELDVGIAGAALVHGDEVAAAAQVHAELEERVLAQGCHAPSLLLQLRHALRVRRAGDRQRVLPRLHTNAPRSTLEKTLLGRRKLIALQ